jgi:hypothetical protein
VYKDLITLTIVGEFTYLRIIIIIICVMIMVYLMAMLLQRIIECQMLERLEKRPNEIEGMWKEAVVAYFQVPFRDLSGGTEEGNENLTHQRSPMNRELNLGSPEGE